MRDDDMKYNLVVVSLDILKEFDPSVKQLGILCVYDPPKVDGTQYISRVLNGEDVIQDFIESEIYYEDYLYTALKDVVRDLDSTKAIPVLCLDVATDEGNIGVLGEGRVGIAIGMI